eukprot:26493-Pelagococcus_subviridis.AAC.2
MSVAITLASVATMLFTSTPDGVDFHERPRDALRLPLPHAFALEEELHARHVDREVPGQPALDAVGRAQERRGELRARLLARHARRFLEEFSTLADRLAEFLVADALLAVARGVAVPRAA